MSNHFSRDFRQILPQPEEFSKKYRGSTISVHFFMLYNTVMTFRSLMHLLLPDSGLSVIAGFDTSGKDWPNINHFGSQWGLE